MISVTPTQVSAAGGTAVEVRGERFWPSTVIYFDGHELIKPVFTGTTLIRGQAPALAPAGIGVVHKPALGVPG